MQTDKQTDFANQGDTISRHGVYAWLCNMGHEHLADAVMDENRFPSVQTDPISEEYAKAVRCWLVNYQIKCAELQGRYTPYEILGWIVSDWRKDNEIW